MTATMKRRNNVTSTRWKRGGLTFMTVYNNLALDQAANDTAADFVREKIGEIVKDQRPPRNCCSRSTYPIGTKRICIDTDYFETFNRPNVTLVDIKTHPIDEILPNAVRSGGKDYEIDALVLATGFDAMTGSVAKIDIRGRGGVTLNQKWAEGPKTYLGLMSAGFPEPLHHHRPRQPVGAVEHDGLDRAACRLDHGLRRLHARPRPRHHGSGASGGGEMGGPCQRGRLSTLYPQANSWYMGANIPGKPRIFMPYIGGVGPYRQNLQRGRGQGLPGLCGIDAGRHGGGP